MFGSEVMLIMVLLRLVIPIGLLLWLGEVARRRERTEFRRISGQA